MAKLIIGRNMKGHIVGEKAMTRPPNFISRNYDFKAIILSLQDR
jgi:hypothetical protein